MSVNATLYLAYQTVAKRPLKMLRESAAHSTTKPLLLWQSGWHWTGLWFWFRPCHYLDEQADTDGTKAISGLPCVLLKSSCPSWPLKRLCLWNWYTLKTFWWGWFISLKAYEHYQLKSAWLWEHPFEHALSLVMKRFAKNLKPRDIDSI